MLLTLGRGLAPAGRGEGVEAAPLRLTDLVPGLTANWEPYYASSLAEALVDTTGNGNHLTAVGTPTLADINGAAPGISLDGATQYLTANSLGASLSGTNTPFSLALVAEIGDLSSSQMYFQAGDGSSDYVHWRTAGTGSFQVRRNIAGPGVITANSASDQNNTVPAVLILSFNGSTVTLYKDNVTVANIDGANLALAGTYALTLVYFGAQIGVGPNWGGVIAPCCIRTGGVFSAANRTAVQSFLSVQFGLA